MSAKFIPKRDTFALVKPIHASAFYLGVILSRIEDAGFAIEERRHIRSPRAEVVAWHLRGLLQRKLPEIFERNFRFLYGGPVVALHLRAVEGVPAVSALRKLVGATDPAAAAPGTLRREFSSDSIHLAGNENRAVWNVIHAADSGKAAKAEYARWFA